VAVENVAGLAPGIYHYLPGPGLLEHRLELVKKGAVGKKLWALSTKQDFIKQAPLHVLLTSVTARMVEKYGDKIALRYVFMEMGHTAQNLHLQAEAMGLGSVAVGYLDEGAVRALLGVQVDPYYFVSVGRRKQV
jgi:SagB-type dehydrogenase family enzyme